MKSSCREALAAISAAALLAAGVVTTAPAQSVRVSSHAVSLAAFYDTPYVVVQPGTDFPPGVPPNVPPGQLPDFGQLAAQIPTFYIGPVQVGGGLLYSAFRNGGLPGVVSYITSQLPSGELPGVQQLAAQIPTFYIGSVKLGQGVLYNAFKDGGLPGVASYIADNSNLIRNLTGNLTGTESGSRLVAPRTAAAIAAPAVPTNRQSAGVTRAAGTAAAPAAASVTRAALPQRNSGPAAHRTAAAARNLGR